MAKACDILSPSASSREDQRESSRKKKHSCVSCSIITGIRREERVDQASQVAVDGDVARPEPASADRASLN